jgi:hypothetical protein
MTAGGLRYAAQTGAAQRIIVEKEIERWELRLTIPIHLPDVT